MRTFTTSLEYIGQFLKVSEKIMTLLIFCALIVYPFPGLSAFQETEVDGFYLDISSSGPQKISKLVSLKKRLANVYL